MSKKKLLKPKVAAKPTEAAKSQPTWSWKFLLPILAFTALCLSSTLPNEFVNWDDDRNVFENPLITELSAKNIQAIFTTHVIGNYNPLPILSFAIEHHFFGMNPRAMHATNLILHLLCTFFVFRICRQLHPGIWIAVVTATLFGIHPMRVESVAWITERKDVLFGLFFFWGLYLYIKNFYRRSFARSLGIFALFFLGLFSKIQMVTFPLTLLVIDYYFNKKFTLKMVLEKWLYFLGSLLFGCIGIYFLKEQGSLETNVTTAVGIDRLFIGSYSLITYLVKWLVPYRLLPLYPYPESLTVWHYLSMPLALGLAYYLFVAYKKAKTELVFGALFFLVNIMFLLQILGAGQGYLADRFTYVAYWGLFFLSAFYFNSFMEKKPAWRSYLLSLGGLYILILAFITYKQGRYWKNSDTLWSRVIEYYDNTPLPFNNRANYYRDLKNYDLALKDYDKAISLKAGHGTYNSRAKLYFIRNEDEKALHDYNKAIELAPNRAEYYVNRGAALAKLGRVEQALADFNRGLQLDPTWKVGYLNRSIMYNQMGRYEEALRDINKYLEFSPKEPDLWYEGARCLRLLNRPNEAIKYYDRAILLNPKVGLFYKERGATQKDLGNREAALRDFEAARKLGEPIDPALYQ